jgi:chromosome segregation ATPase
VLWINFSTEHVLLFTVWFLQETRKQLESAQADNSRLTQQLASLKKQLDQAAAAPATSSKQVQEVQAQAAQLVEKVRGGL